MSDVEQRRQTVIDISVYNAVNMGRRDLTKGEVLKFLRARWTPTWGEFDVVMSETIVSASARRLQKQGLVRVAGNTIVIPIRDPRGMGRRVEVTKDRLGLTWRGKAA